MNWEAVAAISDVVGAIAIVVTLIYLARQLGQNTRAIKSATWQAVQDAEQRLDELIVTDANLADLVERGMRDGEESLEGAERVRFLTFQKQIMDQFHTHHYHYESGIVDDELWKMWVAQVDDLIRNRPYMRRYWALRRQSFRPSFAAFIEDRFRQNGIEIDDRSTASNDLRSRDAT